MTRKKGKPAACRFEQEKEKGNLKVVGGRAHEQTRGTENKRTSEKESQ